LPSPSDTPGRSGRSQERMKGNRVLKKMEATSTLMASVGCMALLCMMLICTIDVIGRYFFNTPVTGAFEITEFLVLILIFSFIGYTQSKKAHVSVDLLFTLFPRRLQVVIDLITHTMCLVLMGLITWMSIIKALELIEVGAVSPNLKIPTYPFVFFLVLGCAVMCIQYLVDIVRLLVDRKENTAS